jgi:hypothetical protein
MANEFYYSVSLSIVHPTIDPHWITRTIPSLNPRIQTMAGTERRGTGGEPIVPSRKALLTHWLADLQQEPKLYSDVKPLSDFILEKMTDLEKFHDIFAHLRQDGEVVLVVGWFSEDNYSAGVLSAEALQKCGELGIDIEINFYSPDNQKNGKRGKEKGRDP